MKLESLRNEYETLCIQIKSSSYYEMIFGANSPDDKDSNIIRWEMNEKIPNLLKMIEWEENKKKQDFYTNDCKASLKKVQKLLDDGRWENEK